MTSKSKSAVNRKVISERIYKLKEKAISEESVNLLEEFQEVFGTDFPAAQSKLELVTNELTDEECRQMLLNRLNIYELLLDNSVEEIVSYIRVGASGGVKFMFEGKETINGPDDETPN